jgi:AP-3 complex subunit mu
MIQSLFLLSPTGEVLIERHFRGVVTSRSVCDSFWERASISMNHHGGVAATSSSSSSYHYGTGEQLIYDSVPPVLEVPESDQGTLYIVSILRDGLSYLAVCPAEVSPLLILEFLARIHKIFTEYFNGLPADEAAIKDNFSTVYQLLEEMVDYGWPLTTEPNALKALIRPPSVLTKLLNANATTVSDALPSGTVSNMPWRASNVHYSQNEIYMDIVEAVDAIVNGSDGKIINTDVSGAIE